MLHYSQGTVFNSGCQAIVNAVNIVGHMGAGLALEFGLRYPEMLQKYKEQAEQHKLKVGQVEFYHEKNEIIVNFPTKAHFAHPSRIEWIESGLHDFRKRYADVGITSIGFPRLGTANGGLQWPQVRTLMERYLSDLPITVVICEDTLPYAEGLEGKMVSRFNNCDLKKLPQLSKIRLNDQQQHSLERLKPLDRFWKLSRADKIGPVTYQKLFAYFSRNNEEGSEIYFQESLPINF